MPFASGVYTPPTGAENATPGKIIASATWNAIFIDIATAMTQLAQGVVINPPRVVTAAGAVTVSIADVLILMNQTVAASVAINLPTSASYTGYELVIKDAAGVAAANNLTVTPSGIEKIDNLTSYTINANYGALRVRPLPSSIGNGWYVVGS